MVDVLVDNVRLNQFDYCIRISNIYVRGHYHFVNFYGYVVDILVSWGGCGHSSVSVGYVVSTKSMLYCHTKENNANF